MEKYIDAERLAKAIEDKGLDCSFALKMERLDTLALIDSLQQEQNDMGEVSDGYHTFRELYYYRMLYNAAFFNLLPKDWVHKSKRHHTGEECFGGGWFIVMAELPTGQISNHYELKDWDLFQVPEKEFADEWDGHTPQEAAERLHKYLQQEQPELPKIGMAEYYYHKGICEGFSQGSAEALKILDKFEKAKADPVIVIKQYEQPEVDLEKELDQWRHEHFAGKRDGHYSGEYLERSSQLDLARHFFNRGLNARKEQ